MTSRIGRLAVHEYGDSSAPTLLLLHGITDSGESWGDLVERLGPSYRVVAPDALGHGASDRFTPQELADSAGEALSLSAELLLEQLAEAGPVLLLGHSMGGATAADLAARRPELVAAVVLEDPAWMEPETLTQRQAYAAERVAGVRRTAADLDAAVAACRAQNPAWPERELVPWAQAKADVDLELLATGVAVPARPWQEIAADITPPALVVTGEGPEPPALIDEERRKQLADIGNPAIEVEVVRGAGHCVRRDRGDAFHALVDPWLRAHAVG